MLKQLVLRVTGTPPPAGASRDEQLRWVRRFYRVNLIAVLVVVLLALVLGGGFLWIVAGVSAVVSAGGFLATSSRIRRDRR